MPVGVARTFGPKNMTVIYGAIFMAFIPAGGFVAIIGEFYYAIGWFLFFTIAAASTFTSKYFMH